MTGRILVPVFLAFYVTVSMFPLAAKASGNKPCDRLWNHTGGIPVGTRIEPVVGASRPTKSEGETIRVLWTVSGYVIGKNSEWGDKEAKALLFKPLDINENGIVFDGRPCSGVTFRRETVEAERFLRDAWQVTPQILGIKDKELQVFQTDCDLPGFQRYVRLHDARLIVPIHGVFFFFEPAVNR